MHGKTVKILAYPSRVDSSCTDVFLYGRRFLMFYCCVSWGLWHSTL